MYKIDQSLTLPEHGAVYIIVDRSANEILWLGETSNLRDRANRKHFHGHLDQGIKAGMIADGTALNAADAKAKMAKLAVIPLEWERERNARVAKERMLRPILKPKYGLR